MMKATLDWKKYLDVLLQAAFWQRASFVITLILIVIISWMLAGVGWRLLPVPPQVRPPIVTAPASRIVPEQALGGAAGRIAQWHLFGRAQHAGTQARQPTPVVMPETKLALVLRGVFASKDPTKAGAIVSQRNGQQAFYTLGAQLPGGAMLKEVHTDRIVLLRNHRLETLRLPKETTGKNAAIPRGSAGGRFSPASGANMSLKGYRDLLLDNPQKVADLVQLQPYRQGGRLLGYRVQPGRDRGFLSRFGLQSGDVVTAVNGIRINSPARGLSIMRSLAKNANEVRIELLRRGVSRSIVLNLNQ